MKHKIEIGGPPCPTCGFKITSRKTSRPFVIEDDSMETVEREIGHTQNAEQFLSDVADHLKVQPQPSDGGVAGEPVESEDISIGGITWHSSDEDSGPDVGISVYLGHDDRLWCGEISRKTFEENNGGAHFDSDGGWWLVRYQGSESKLIAKCADDLEAREFIEQISIWLRALPPVPGNEGREAVIEECAKIAETVYSRMFPKPSNRITAENAGHAAAREIRALTQSLPRSDGNTP